MSERKTITLLFRAEADGGTPGNETYYTEPHGGPRFEGGFVVIETIAHGTFAFPADRIAKVVVE